jgi:hypothetical protein
MMRLGTRYVRQDEAATLIASQAVVLHPSISVRPKVPSENGG